MSLRFSRLQPEAIPPTRKHPQDAGVDVYSNENVILWPFSYRNIHTGITLEIPDGFMLLAKPKGRNNHLLGAGVIDAGYQGEIVIKVVNYSWKLMRIHKGDAIAQLIQIPVICELPEEVAVNEIHAKASQRGASGGIHST